MSQEIRRIYTRLINEHYPELAGLPPDDGGQAFCETLVDLPDEELKHLVGFGESDLLPWAEQRFEALIVDGWFRDELIEVLTLHAGDMIGEDPEIADQDIEHAIRYLAAKSTPLELLNRFGDDRARWLQLIRLARLNG